MTTARVPGIDDGTFQETAKTAKDGCIISRALAGVSNITLDATLAAWERSYIDHLQRAFVIDDDVALRIMEVLLIKNRPWPGAGRGACSMAPSGRVSCRR